MTIADSIAEAPRRRLLGEYPRLAVSATKQVVQHVENDPLGHITALLPALFALRLTLLPLLLAQIPVTRG